MLFSAERTEVQDSEVPTVTVGTEFPFIFIKSIGGQLGVNVDNCEGLRAHETLSLGLFVCLVVTCNIFASIAARFCGIVHGRSDGLEVILTRLMIENFTVFCNSQL
jgi:hypothetical protein